MSNNVQVKKVKIVASVGPKSDTKQTIFNMAKAGVDVFRFNFSHCTRDEAIRRARYVRSAEKALKKKLTIMADLMGPKIRIGSIEPETLDLRDGSIFEITFGTFSGSAARVSLDIPNVLNHLENGDDIYLGDGDIKLEVIEAIPGGVRTRVVIGGELRSRMGFQAKTLSLASFALSEKDKTDLETALEIGADAVALSFVQADKDIEAVKALLPKEERPLIVAKLETSAGLKNAESILEAADVLMIARGDLAFTIPLEELPHVQKSLISLALRVGKPVITATHMLESMTKNLFPTRAEVTDVANAVLDGTDAVMTSGETAKGKHPAVVIETMSKIIGAAETRLNPQYFKDDGVEAEALASGAVKIADQLSARLIIVFTETGKTARLISRHRPNQIIIALSPNNRTIHGLGFTWGVFSHEIKQTKNIQGMIAKAKEIARNNPYIQLKQNEAFVICAGIPFDESGSTNLIFVDRV